MRKNHFTTAEAAKQLGICKSTLFNWEKKGIIDEPKRIQIGKIRHRIFTHNDLNQIRIQKDLEFPPKPN